MKYKSRICFLCVFFILYILAGFVFAQDDTLVNKNDKSFFKHLIKSAHNELINGNYDQVLIFADSAYLIDSSSVDVFFYRASATAMSGDTAGSINILMDALKVAPHSTRIKLYLIRLFLEQGNTAEAIKYTDEILAIRPKDGEALYFKGLGFLMTGDTTTAIELFDKAILNSLE